MVSPVIVSLVAAELSGSGVCATPLSVGVIVYPVIGIPPSLAGADQCTVTCPSPGVPPTAVGFPAIAVIVASAAFASRYPPPTASGVPLVATDRAVSCIALTTSAGVSDGCFARRSAPIAAACGAAADVP